MECSLQQLSFFCVRVNRRNEKTYTNIHVSLSETGNLRTENLFFIPTNVNSSKLQDVVFDIIDPF